MRIKRNEVREYLSGLYSVGNLKGLKFAYAVSRNIKNFEAIAKDIQKKGVIEKTKELDKYNEEKEKLLKKYAKKDDSGNYVIDKKTQEYQFEDKEKYIENANKLIEGSPKLKEQLDKHSEEFNKYLKDDVSVNLFTIKKDDLPVEISANQLNAIDFMIE